MSADHLLFIGWNRPTAGKEPESFALFADVMAFYGKQLAEKKITGFEPVVLDPHGGDLNGFILVRGSREQLDALRGSEQFDTFNVRANLCLESFGVTGGATGARLQGLMGQYQKHSSK